MVWLLVREPRRGALDVPAGADETYVSPPKAPFGATCRMFFTRPTLLLLALACAANQFITYASGNFATLFLMEEKGMTLQQVAIWYALLVLFAMGGGIFFAGRLVDRLARRDRRAYALIPALGLAIAIPFFVGFIWAPRWELAMMMLIVPFALNYFYLSPAVALVQESVRPNERVLAGALLLLVMNLVGLGLGPTWLGWASDMLRPYYPGHSLQMAFYTLVPFYFLAIGLFLLLARALKREAEEAK
jgi:MFS family permease